MNIPLAVSTSKHGRTPKAHTLGAGRSCPELQATQGNSRSCINQKEKNVAIHFRA